MLILMQICTEAPKTARINTFSIQIMDLNFPSDWVSSHDVEGLVTSDPNILWGWSEKWHCSSFCGSQNCSKSVRLLSQVNRHLQLRKWL